MQPLIEYYPKPENGAWETPVFYELLRRGLGNLPLVQEGLRASATGAIHFGSYSELRIRKVHQLIDAYIAGAG